MLCKQLLRSAIKGHSRPISVVCEHGLVTRSLSSSISADKQKADVDICIVGGGIVGLATAQELIHRYPEMTFALVEKEKGLATHQSGNNSGVIHAGIYYKPGSLMAKLCVEGLLSTYKYCDKHQILYKKCGKVVVATEQQEISRLDGLYARALENGVPGIAMLDGEEAIQKIEPYCRGLKAIWSPNTGIVDFGVVARHYGKVFASRGGKVLTDFEVSSIGESEDPSRPVILRGKKADQEVRASYVLTCAGLHSDRVAKMSGGEEDPKIIAFRGEYLLLNPEIAKHIRGNIYPVPDPRFPFLGFHFTPRMNGEVWLGPNAVMSLKREGYKWSDFSSKDLREILAYPGFYKLAKKYINFGSSEIIRSIFIRLAVPHLQRFVPQVTAADISRGPAGVRAQAMNVNGDLVNDFAFDCLPRILHCRNAPSPAATSSLAIAKMMASKAEQEFQLPKRPPAELY